jgi:hypothetical protein
MNPVKEWVTTDVPELQIIDPAIWERAQTLKSCYVSHAGNKRQTKKRLLNGLIKCGCCGGRKVPVMPPEVLQPKQLKFECWTACVGSLSVMTL